MPGGAGLVAVKYTKNPEDVAKVMDYLASEAIVKEFTERTLFLPAHKGVVARAGSTSRATTQLVKAALDAFVEASATTSPAAARSCRAGNGPTPIYGALVTRVSQVIAGELTLDDAWVTHRRGHRRARSPRRREQ